MLSSTKAGTRFHGDIPPAHPSDDALSHASHIMRRIYGYPQLHEHQKEVLQEFLTGRDTLAIIPTGGGKSLCYVLPAMMGPGLGVVVSPLIALIRDQVIAQRKVGIAAAALDSLQTQEEKSQVLHALQRGLVKLLYIAPERLARLDFHHFLAALPLRFVAVDEAHCASEWGTDFRPEYRKLGRYFDRLPSSVPRLALTATATHQVRCDMIRFLGLRHPKQIIKDPLRDNLKIKTRILGKKAYHSAQIMKDIPRPQEQGILYAFSRKNCEDLAQSLVQHGMKAQPYHGGLDAHLRRSTQRNFLDGTTTCVVATNAFGLGIDQKNIRFVHHYGLPTSLESYIQQIGRAGRDGAAASCSLFFRTGDFEFHKKLICASYPSLHALQKCYSALESLGGRRGVVVALPLFQKLYSSGESEQTVQRCLEILTKEKFVRSFQSGTKDHLSATWSLMQQSGALEDFLQHYPERKKETLRRLKAMYAYARCSEQVREKLVKRYFAQPLSCKK